MILPRSLAYDRTGVRVEIVPIQPPPETFFDDSLPPTDRDYADFAERFRIICDLLEQGPPKSAAIRIAALRRVLGYDRSSLRQKTRELNCSPSTLHTAVKAILRGMKSNSF
jgi:hypothetical protein